MFFGIYPKTKTKKQNKTKQKTKPKKKKNTKFLKMLSSLVLLKISISMLCFLIFQVFAAFKFHAK